MSAEKDYDNEVGRYKPTVIPTDKIFQSPFHMFFNDHSKYSTYQNKSYLEQIMEA